MVLSAALVVACGGSDPTFNEDEGSGDSVPGGEVEVGGGQSFGDGEGGDTTEGTTGSTTTGTPDDDDDDEDTSAGEESSDDGTTTGEPPPPMPSPACGGQTLGPGSYDNLEIDEIDENERRYDLYIPELHDGVTPLPLVIDFHDAGNNEEPQKDLSGMQTAAEEEGFVAVHPRGRFNSWNAGDCCGGAEDNNVDDVGFVRTLITELGMDVCFDQRLVFATGFGNGAALAYRLACDASDVIAAVAPVAGVLALNPAFCTPQREVPVMHFHGTGDLLSPYNGGGPLGALSVTDSVQTFQSLNACVGPSMVTFSVGDTVCERWSDCAAGSEVVLCTIEGMGALLAGQSELQRVPVDHAIGHERDARVLCFASAPVKRPKSARGAVFPR